jgi:hypothetical protein
MFRPLTPYISARSVRETVRFYRKNFLTFIMIAAPPVIVGTLISVGWTVLGRQLFAGNLDPRSGDTALYYVFVWFGNAVIWMAETIATLVVMGGASRNFVRHLLFGEPITFRETYDNTRKRFFALVGASSLITILLSVIGFIFFYFGLMITGLLIILIIGIFSSIPVVATILSIVAGIIGSAGTIWLFFLIASRFAYVPQIMLVEGQGITSAVSRSASLASGNAATDRVIFVHIGGHVFCLSDPLRSACLVRVGSGCRGDDLQCGPDSGMVRDLVQSDLADQFDIAIACLDDRTLFALC